MNDYCIENDLPAQKERAEMEDARMHNLVVSLREELEQEKRNTKVEKLSGHAIINMFDEYRAAMEYYFGGDECDKALHEYRTKK